MHRGTRCPLGSATGRRARRQATPTDLARRRTARSRSIHSVHPETVPGLPGHEIEEVLLNWIDMGYDPENYCQAQLNELDSLTVSDGSPTISETQTPQKHEREFVTLEVIRRCVKNWRDVV